MKSNLYSMKSKLYLAKSKLYFIFVSLLLQLLYTIEKRFAVRGMWLLPK